MKRLLIAVAVALALLPAAGHAGGISQIVLRSVVVESAAPPADTLALWIDTDDGVLCSYHPGPEIWRSMAPVMIVEASRTSDNFFGPLKFGNNIDMDTTTTSDAMNGYPFADSVFVSAWTFQSENAGGTVVDTKVQLFRCTSGGSVLDILLAGDKGAWASNRLFATEQEVFGGPGTYAIYVFDGTQEPYAPTVWFEFYKFARKP